MHFNFINTYKEIPIEQIQAQDVIITELLFATIKETGLTLMIDWYTKIDFYPVYSEIIIKECLTDRIQSIKAPVKVLRNRISNK